MSNHSSNLVAFPSIDQLLFRAVDKGDMIAAQRAIERGANVNAQDEEGQTPLMMACMETHATMARYLLSYGARIDAIDRNKHTALMHAAMHLNINAMKLLLSGTSISNDEKAIALQLTLSVLPFESTRGEDVTSLVGDAITEVRSTRFPDSQDYEQQVLDGVMLLLESGLDPNHIIPTGDIYDEHDNIISLYDEQGILGLFSDTPLYLACIEGLPRVALFLLEQGVDIDNVNLFGETALMGAVSYCHPHIASLLLAQGASTDARNEDGQTVFDLTQDGVWDAILSIEGCSDPLLAIMPSPPEPKKTPFKLHSV